jgi:hypothetical protein
LILSFPSKDEIANNHTARECSAAQLALLFFVHKQLIGCCEALAKL